MMSKLPYRTAAIASRLAKPISSNAAWTFPWHSFSTGRPSTPGAPAPGAVAAAAVNADAVELLARQFQRSLSQLNLMPRFGTHHRIASAMDPDQHPIGLGTT